MGPEVARSFGLKVSINQDYIEARELNNRANRLFDRAVSAITTQKKEKVSGEHSKRAGKLALESREARELMRKSLNCGQKRSMLFR